MIQAESPPYIFSVLYEIIFQAPGYVIFLEFSLLMLVIWIIIHKQSNGGKKLTSDEKAEILRNWQPESLVPEIDANHPALLNNHVVDGPVGKYITVDGTKCLNMATHNYLGLEEYPVIKEKAIECVHKYGVGSCGPRGFYGTVDVHLELEERLARFMDQEEAVVYSYGFSTIASAIPAYSKRTDIIFADECVNFAIQKGIDASRSKVVYFKHNDMRDLEKRLEEQASIDQKNPKKAAKTRRFLIVEGIYINTGELCPLRELIELRAKYKLRLFLDEGISFGTIGKNGHGVTELLCIDKSEVDLISGSLENAVESIGGFCVGSHFIVEHQRLSGLGYCFSASQPPLLTQAAISALDIFEQKPEIFKQLNDVAVAVDEQFRYFSKMEIRGHPLSPVKHLYLKYVDDADECARILRKIADECIKKGLAVVSAEYLPIEKSKPKNSLRITVNRLLTADDISSAYKILEEVSKKVA